MPPVTIHVPLPGSYSSALLKEPPALRLYPPTTNTWPEGKRVAVL